MSESKHRSSGDELEPICGSGLALSEQPFGILFRLCCFGCFKSVLNWHQEPEPEFNLLHYKTRTKLDLDQRTNRKSLTSWFYWTKTSVILDHDYRQNRSETRPWPAEPEQKLQHWWSWRTSCHVLFLSHSHSLSGPKLSVSINCPGPTPQWA